MTVKVIEIDQMKRINLSRKVLLPVPEGEEQQQPANDEAPRPPRRDFNSGGNRDRGGRDNRGPRR
jgi:polyribonucleotide nucleotidyltransferase